MEILPAAPLLFCPVVEASAKKAVECVKASSQWMVFLLQGNQKGIGKKMVFCERGYAPACSLSDL